MAKNEAGEVQQCPSPSTPYNEHCCCGSGCCWDRCVWPNPPEDCIKGVQNSQWAFNTDKIYWRAVKNFASQPGFKFFTNKCCKNNFSTSPSTIFEIWMFGFSAGLLIEIFSVLDWCHLSGPSLNPARGKSCLYFYWNFWKSMFLFRSWSNLKPVFE